MLHLRSRYEILQACTQPIKVEDEPFLVPQLFGKKLSYDDFNKIFPCFLGQEDNNIANFEHYDFKDDNELDLNI